MFVRHPRHLYGIINAAIIMHEKHVNALYANYRGHTTFLRRTIFGTSFKNLRFAYSHAIRENRSPLDGWSEKYIVPWVKRICMYRRCCIIIPYIMSTEATRKKYPIRLRVERVCKVSPLVYMKGERRWVDRSRLGFFRGDIAL